MSPDGITLNLIVRELQKLVQGRVDRIHQPEKLLVIIGIRKAGKSYRLLLSAQAEAARIHLTSGEKPNPPRPPLFCLVLRKHLEGSRLVAIEQLGLDRVVNLTFSRLAESGGYQPVTLTCEIMGKHSNLVLHDPGRGEVIDGIKRYSHALSRYREILPGRPYLPPPPQQRIDPRSLDEESFNKLVLAEPLDHTIKNILRTRLAGIGPELAEELLLQAGLDPGLRLDYCGAYELECLWQGIGAVVMPLLEGKCQPTIYYRGNEPELCYPIPLTGYRQFRTQSYPTVNQLFDAYYQWKERLTNFRQLQHRLQAVIKHELERCAKKLALQQEAEEKAKRADILRLQGEMIYAHLHLIRSGDSEVVLPNLYQPDSPSLHITLDPDLSPVQNAQLILRRYDKARDSLKPVLAQKKLTQEELDYLASVNNALIQAESSAELDQIANELQETGYLTEKKKERNHRHLERKEHPTPRRIRVDGGEILIGRNNKQNDYLTLRLANDEDYWFHVKGGAGAHVLLRVEAGQEFTPELLELAAAYAAYFSEERQSTKVAVDYTRRKFVSKPPKSRPGYVIYQNYHTIYVEPKQPPAQQ